MELKEKVAIVTGASSGIGKEIALALGKEGVRLALLARRKAKLAEVLNEIEKNGGEGLFVPTDVTDEQEVRRAIEIVVKEYKRIDILINVAGLGIFKTVEAMSRDEWSKQIDVMLNGTFLVTHHALPHIYEQKSGHVIAISSLWAKRFCGLCAAYTAAKFGVRGLLQSLREEARQHNVKVTNIMPGTVDTPFFDKADWNTDLSQALQPKDIADSVLFTLKLPDRAVVEELALQAIKPDKKNN